MEEAAKEHKQIDKKFQKLILRNNLINSMDSLIVVETTSIFVKLSITGFGIKVVAIAAGARCGFAVPNEVQTPYHQNKGRSNLEKYIFSQETIRSLNASFRNFTRQQFQ